MSEVDITVSNHGTIVILEPITQAAIEWMDEHIDPDATRWGPNGYVIEPRYVHDILEGATEDGLTWE